MTKNEGNERVKEAPLVSVGVPAYNGEEYLEECLDSILDQTYTHWECVIINNYSSDRTAEIAGRYVEKDPRFKLYHTDELLPITTNWNYCYSKISQEAAYFKILPADDWIFPEFLEQMVAIMQDDPRVGICSSFRLVDRKLRSQGLDVYRGPRFDGKEILTGQLREDLDATSSVNAVLYRVSTLKELEYHPEIYQDESYHMDTFLSYELLTISDLGFIFQVLSYTRRHENTVTSNVSNRFGTAYFFREFVLHHYLDRIPEIQPAYRRLRIAYAYELFRARIRFRKDVIRWHRQRLKRPIRSGEYVAAIWNRIWRNRF